MRKLILFFFCFAAFSATAAWSQQMPTASRAGDLQVGAGFSFAQPDYTDDIFKGYGIYADFDFKAHWGVEADFHQVNQSYSQGGPYGMIYERTYEIGPRYVLHYNRFAPYTKFLVGRGVFNYPLVGYPGEPTTDPHANLAYNIFTPGAGVDYHLNRSINLRADFEYQFWPGFTPHGLEPRVFTVGAAYHFH